MLEALRFTLSEGLDVATEAGKILAASSSLPEALTGVANLCVLRFCDSFVLEVSGEALGNGGLRIETGPRRLERAARTAVSAPLVAGGVPAGTLSCTFDNARVQKREFEQIVEIVAQLISISIVTHNVSSRERRVADRLQRALLPRDLPDAREFELTAAYRPASDEAVVGGDWYDAFMLPNGLLAISVGDVAGHGLDAAVVMGELRQTVRAAATAGQRPSYVLEQINDTFRLLGGLSGMATATFALYDPETNELCYAGAGHPPPVIALEDGSVWQFPVGGLPLGCAASIDSRNWTFTLPAGGTVYFYTDGLIENDRDIERGERELLGAIHELASAGERSAARLLETIFAHNTNRDDAAALTLTSRNDVTAFAFSSIPLAAPLARCILVAALAKTSLDESRRFGAQLALTEAVANAIEHGYAGEPDGLVRLTFDIRDTSADITVEDSGHWKTFARDIVRGRGLQVMQAFTDGVQIRSMRDATVVSLRIGEPA